MLAAQQTIASERWYQGTADAVRQTLPNLRAQNMDNILILAGDHLYQMDYAAFTRFHRESGADLTVAVKPVSRDQASGFGILKMNAEKRITEFFEKPPENLSIEFSGVTVLDEQSCSACQSTLLLFLRRHGEKLFGGKVSESDTNIAIGKGHEAVPLDTLCIGNCTAKFKNDRPFVPGCPPVASEILNVYNEYYQE